MKSKKASITPVGLRPVNYYDDEYQNAYKPNNYAMYNMLESRENKMSHYNNNEGMKAGWFACKFHKNQRPNNYIGWKIFQLPIQEDLAYRPPIAWSHERLGIKILTDPPVPMMFQ